MRKKVLWRWQFETRVTTKWILQLCWWEIERWWADFTWIDTGK